jgi:hypothetical protein
MIDWEKEGWFLDDDTIESTSASLSAREIDISDGLGNINQQECQRLLLDESELIASEDGCIKVRKGDYQDYHDVHAKYCYGLLWWSVTHRLSSHTYVRSLVSTLSSTYLPC